MNTKTITLADFIAQHSITMRVAAVDANPHMDDRNMDHWKVELARDRARLTTYFSKGFGHNGKAPEVDEVLDCLASDASTIDNVMDFEAFCSDLGYDSDSRRAEKIYKACARGAKSLRRFLGESLYQTLLYNTERL